MIKPELFYKILDTNGINFFCGVPDSLLKDFGSFIQDNVKAENHVITVNEGSAIGLATGYHLATNKIPFVYMQNSGIGNAINPILSLADSDVYSIPMLLMIGWRGEPGIKDEPQHIKQGAVTEHLLKSIGVEFEILSTDLSIADNQVKKAVDYMEKNNSPYVLLVKKNTFDKYSLVDVISDDSTINREVAIEKIISRLGENDFIVSTTGKLSRELYEIRDKLSQPHSYDFLTVGSMGHASQIALGIAMNSPEKRVFCFDGDGALLMHMGSLASIGKISPSNFIHIVFNNYSHDSVGGQPTVSEVVDFKKLAISCGYKMSYSIKNIEELDSIVSNMDFQGPVLIELIVNKGARADLGRPKSSPIENKNAFMEKLKN